MSEAAEKLIDLVKDFDLGSFTRSEKDIDVKEIFSGPSRKIVEVRLQDNAVLSRHKADVPITVFCLAGNGVFHAGSLLEDSQRLTAGTLITLDANIDHEVTAEPDLHLVVSKFRDS